MSVVCYTAIYGAYDTLKPHPDTDIVDDWICFTDNPALACEGWDVIVQAVNLPHPRMQAKWHKCYPPAQYSQSIWIDGSMKVTNPAFFSAVADLLEVGDMVMFPHPERTSIITEAAVSEGMLKYRDLPVMRQAQHYISEGWTDHELWASTTIGRNHTPNVRALGAAWFAECENWTYQDQISLPPLVHKHDVDAVGMPHSLWANPWFHLTGHASDL
jgi:hypothetical protein